MAGLAFVFVEITDMGWRPSDEREVKLIQLDAIAEEALPLGYRTGMINAWVHNIRVGQVVDFHEHPGRAELVVILRGRVRVRGLRKALDGGDPILREEVLGPGNMIFSPPGSVHEYTNIGSGPLWSLVFMSPPVEQNLYLEGASPKSEKDFLVVPLGVEGVVRGEFIPAWARNGEQPWQGEIGYYPGISGRVLRDDRQLEGRHPGYESWVILVGGSGTLSLADTKQTVDAPTWFSAPDGRWSLRGDRGELVALEFSLPNFDAGLFLRATIERYGRPSVQE